jgi:hypothetical protein
MFPKLMVMQDFYALGDGASLSGSHYIGNDLSTSYTGCQGVYQLAREPPGAGLIDANIALTCTGQPGNIVAPFNFMINNQHLACVLLNRNDGTNAFYHICGPSLPAAGACANSVIQKENIAQGSVTTPTYAFLPN